VVVVGGVVVVAGRVVVIVGIGGAVEAVVGGAVVVETIAPKAGGKVELHGTNWAAVADAGIPKGTAVEVIGKENLTLKVKVL